VARRIFADLWQQRASKSTCNGSPARSPAWPSEAARFNGTRKSIAMELRSKLINHDRDEDQEGPAGLRRRVERARLIALKITVKVGIPMKRQQPPRVWLVGSTRLN
jgi:hypothetical protein